MHLLRHRVLYRPLPPSQQPHGQSQSQTDHDPGQHRRGIEPNDSGQGQEDGHSPMVGQAIDTRKTELDAIDRNSRNAFRPCFPESNAMRRAETEQQTGKSGDASLGWAAT